MMIFDANDVPILQESSQELSTSSSSMTGGWGFLDTLVIMLELKFGKQ